MKKTAKVLLSLALCLCIVLSAGLTACGSNGNNSGNGGNKSHACEHVCPECHKCLTDCEEAECADKCQGHTPPHECEDVCPECHKCLTDCEEAECADKCQGHTPPHACEHVCPECHKCLTNCEEPECEDKCQGHTPPHECGDICPECHKCLTDCKEPECEEKCEGHVVSTPISVAAGGTYNMPISNISAGIHIIEADLGATKLTTGRLQAYIGEGGKSELVYSESRSTEGHNIYYGYIKIAEGDTSIIFSAITESVNASVVIKNYEMPTLKADGTPVEMPINIYQTADENLLKIKLDSSSVQVGVSYTLVINGDSALSGTVRIFVGSRGITSIVVSNYKGRAVTFTDEDFAAGGDVYVYLIATTKGEELRQINPVTVTLTQAAA